MQVYKEHIKLLLACGAKIENSSKVEETTKYL
jgi:hypothetical protein